MSNPKTIFSGLASNIPNISDQERMESSSGERRRLSVSPIPIRNLKLNNPRGWKKNITNVSELSPSSSSSSSSASKKYDYFLARADWLSLGEGWFQCTHPASGSSSRCGLHSVIGHKVSFFYFHVIFLSIQKSLCID